MDKNKGRNILLVVTIELGKEYAYPIASSLWSSAFRAFRTSFSLAFFTTAGW